MIFWPRKTATLLKSNLRYFHREKSTFEKFDAGLKLRIVFYTNKTIKNRRKNFRVIYTLKKLQLRSTRFNARAIIDSETESFTEEPIHEYFAQCRYLPFIALRAYALNK